MEDLRREIRASHVSPLWEIAGDLFTKEPRPAARPFLWKGKEIISLLRRAAGSAGLKAEVGRRVLTLIHPDVVAQSGANWNMQIGFQLVEPGDRAPPHRHNAQAARFMIEGGAATVIDGERFDMEPGDFVVTPAWTFHEHLDDGAEQAVWLDILDIPFVARQGLAFFQEYPARWQEVDKTAARALRRAATMGVVPEGRDGAQRLSPLIYKWAGVRAALVEMAHSGDLTRFDGAKLSYHDPASGGPVMPTLGADVILLPAGSGTEAHRHTSASIYYIVEGTGRTTIEGREYEWERHDVLSVPAWAWHSHACTGGEPAVALAVHDEPMLRALQLHIEEGPKR